MSQELTNARRALSKVSTDLKKEQYISAATAVRDTARLFGRIPMMKSEQDEFINMLQTATDLLHYNSGITKIFPLTIKYVPGQEADLGDLMNELIETLQESSTEEAKKRHKAYQQEQLAKARMELEHDRFDEARGILKNLADLYSEDSDLAVEIGDHFMSAGLYEDAVYYLLIAAKLSTGSARVLNRLGIALRKLKRYDEAEIYFARALEQDKEDPNLYFNIGRLYLDQGFWDKAAMCGKRAVALAPDFAEAGKLVTYAERKLAEAKENGVSP